MATQKASFLIILQNRAAVLDKFDKFANVKLLQFLVTLVNGLPVGFHSQVLLSLLITHFFFCKILLMQMSSTHEISFSNHIVICMSHVIQLIWNSFCLFRSSLNHEPLLQPYKYSQIVNTSTSRCLICKCYRFYMNVNVSRL